MKILMALFCTFFASVCFANQPHEFEGISEVYNIRSLKVLSQFLPENPVVIEAGAYEGRDTEYLAKKLRLAQIYTVEPLTTAFPTLLKKVQFYPNVKTFNVALDEVTGSKDFYICHGTNGESPVFEFHSSLLRPIGSSAIHLLGPIEVVPCVSLFDFCEAEQIKKVDMLWLSTEGNELQILKGAGELLNQVSLIYVRTQLYPTRESITLFEDLRKFMEGNGFILLSHFYLKNIHGDAVFVKQEKFTNL